MASTIRVGLVGLGKEMVEQRPGVWGATAHAPYLIASSKYTITAVANSSVESAQASIDFHSLGSSVKAYGNPEDLAADPSVDLVVVAVNVAKHYQLAKPALLAGKDVFVEWPLGATTAEAVELTELAKSKGVKTVVGVQATASPVVLKLKELIGNGKIGRVISSTVVGSFDGLPVGMWMEGAEYYLEKDSGGNLLTIYFGHFLNSFTTILGPFKSHNSIIRTDYPSTVIVSMDTGAVVNPSYQKTAPDHVSLLGTLASGASASITYRTTPSKNIDGTGIRWLITGTEGEIEVTMKEKGWQMAEAEEGEIAIRGRFGLQSEVEEVALGGDEVKEVSERTSTVKNVARLYEAFAAGEEDKIATFVDAVETHRLLDSIREGSL